MKKYVDKWMYSILVIASLFFTACQEEFEEVNNEPSADTIEVGSVTTQLIQQTTNKDGSFDNIVDGASCLAIEFPYTVEIGGVQITIDSVEDLEVIEEIFDEFDTDDDILDIIFPITITLGDFSQIVIESKEALRELAASCLEGGEDEDVECIDFVYPITLFTFDIDNEITARVTVNSDRELRNFIDELEVGTLVGFDFPLTLVKADGTEVVVDSNAELARTLEAAKDACDEDDDDDFNDDDFDEERFDFCLTECPWLVTQVVRNSVDATEQYERFLMNFMEDGSVTVQDREGNMLNGEWSATFTDRGPLLTLEFDTLVDFNLEWLVYEIRDHTIKLFSDAGNRIILEQRCEDDGNGQDDCDIETVADYLENCVWQVADTNLDLNFEGIIDFSNRNIHAFDASGMAVDEGNWATTDNGLQFNDLFGPIAPINGGWSIAECREDRIKLVNDQEQFVVLEKDCEDDGNVDPDSLRNILRECEWIIKKVKNQGEEIERLLGYEFNFMGEGLVTLGNGITTSEGSWEIGPNEEGQLALLITFGEEPAVNFNWPLRDLTNERLRFEVPEIGYELILQRVCDDNAGDMDVAEIRNILLGGQWNVAGYSEGGVDMTENFDGQDFSFSNRHQVEVSINDDPIIAGLWRVIRDSDQDLRFYLNFANDATFGELTDDWEITEVTTDVLELRSESGGDGSVDILIFERKQ